jgi:hypothetical protein
MELRDNPGGSLIRDSSQEIKCHVAILKPRVYLWILVPAEKTRFVASARQLNVNLTEAV